MRVTLRYGREGLEAELPDEHVRHVLRQNRLPKVERPREAVREALARPIGTEALGELAKGRREACIVVSDLTRPVPNAVILPPIIEALRSAGLEAEDMLVLVATGLHRPNTPDELREMLGEEVAGSGCRIENHVARDAASHVRLGETERGTPVAVDRRYVEADLKILTGLVEPHLMAGYSGGRKAICPGLCAVETVMGFHGPELLEPAEACGGNLAGNPVHEEALAAADLAGGADLIVNVTLDEDRDITGVFAGEMRQAHAAAMIRAEQQTKVAIEEPAEIVLTSGGGYPLDLTMYQGIKGIVAAAPIVREGGTIIIAQENAEGIGGEEFTELMLSLHDPHKYVQQALCGGEFCIDAWQLHVLEKVLRHCEVVNVSDGLPADRQRQCFVEPAGSVEEAVRKALDKHGPEARIAVIPDGPYVLSCLSANSC
jgi:nickel-dependent lactate racemase